MFTVKSHVNLVCVVPVHFSITLYYMYTHAYTHSQPPTNPSSGCSRQSSGALVGFPLSALSLMWLPCHQEQEVRVS